MSTKVNIKLLAFLCGGAVLFAVGVHFLHGFQERRNAGALLKQAERAEADGENEQAVKHLRTYLGFVPDDTDALARYGLLLEQLAKSANSRSQALLVLEQVLRRQPERHDIRQKLVDIAMHPQIARYSDAREHLELLLRNFAANDGALEHRLGRCHEAGGDFAQAAAWYEKALQHAPRQIDAYLHLAHVYRRRLDKPQRADQVMDQLVANNGESFQAFLARGRYRLELGQGEAAATDINRAAELAPDDAEVILAAASMAFSKGDIATARLRLERGLDKHADKAELYLALSELEVKAKRPVEAAACLRRGTEAIPADTDLLWALANLLIQQGKEPAAEMARLAQRDVPAAELDFLKARLLANQRQWVQACRLLEKNQVELHRRPDLGKQADLLLAQCYGRLGNIDQQYAAYRRAVTADPLWEPACLGLASVQAAQGQIEDALTTYRRIMARVSGARIAAARLMIAQTSRLPAASQRWQEVEQMLDEAAQALPDAMEVALVRAEALAAQQKFDEAAKLLQETRRAHPQETPPCTALAALAERRGKTDEALTILDEATTALGNKLELRLAQARVWSKKGGDDGRRGLAALAKETDKFSGEEQLRFLAGLAEAHAHLGDAARAERLWLRVADQSPGELGCRVVLFDLALQSGNEKLLERLLKEMESIEGNSGTLWRYAKACCLIRQGRQGQAAHLEEASSILQQLAAARPAWGRVPLAQAEISDLQKDASAAIKSFQRAIELGERNPLAMRRLVELLYQQRRYAEADEVVQKLTAQEDAAPSLQRLAAQISLQRHDPERALKLARRAVSDQSRDYRDYLWLGQVLGATGKPEEAEAAFRRALELADDAPDAWVALILHLARTQQKDKAEAALADAGKKLSAQQAALVSPPCYEALGEIDRARTAHTEALAARPDDVSVLRSATAFMLRHGPSGQTQQLLRKLMAAAPRAPEDAAWAQRTLAVVLAASGDYGQWREALTLVGLREDAEPPKSKDAALEDQRTRAVVLAANQSRKQRQRAVRVLEEIKAGQPLVAEDQFLLAQLHEALGAWPQARQEMLGLLATQPTNPRYVAHYAQSLLGRAETGEAELWLAKLEKLPDVAGTFLLVDLQARVLARRGKAEAALERLREFEENRDAKPAEPDTKLALVTAFLDGLSQAHASEKRFATAAEEHYRQLLERRPERILDCVAFLTRQGRAGEALELCEKAWQSRPPVDVGVASVAALRALPAPTDEQQQRVERRLTAALQKAPATAASMLVCLADLRDLQGRYADAEKLYRQAIAADKNNVIALNNLAYLLALRKEQSAEALELLDRAIGVAGPAPELIDTRALVRLKQGQAQQAIKELEEALTEAPLASLCYHLAQAHKVAKNSAAARDALTRAKGLGLRPEQLHSLERAGYQQLHAELAAR
jgi:tetratricopeptide (TPR) repeat protein